MKQNDFCNLSLYEKVIPFYHDLNGFSYIKIEELFGLYIVNKKLYHYLLQIDYKRLNKFEQLFLFRYVDKTDKKLHPDCKRVYNKWINVIKNEYRTTKNRDF